MFYFFVCTVAPKIMDIIKKGADGQKTGFTATIMHIFAVRRGLKKPRVNKASIVDPLS